jgi:hypothetical protein
MFGFLNKKKQVDEIPKRLVFKSNEAAFQYACKFLNTSLLNESPVLAIVLAVRDNVDCCLKISNPEDSTIPNESPEEIIEKGHLQNICLMAKPMERIPKLKKGDLVMFVASSELIAMGKGTTFGFVVAKVQPIYDIEESGWLGV